MAEYHRLKPLNNNHEEIAALYIFLDIEGRVVFSEKDT